MILPVYNESPRLAAALQRTRDYLTERGLDAEVVVVDDGSADDSAQIAQAHAAADPRVRMVGHSPNRGKGYAVRRGLQEARGRYRVFLDVDMATPVETIDYVLPELEAGAGMVIGSRHRPGSRIEVAQPLVRRLMGTVFRGLAIRGLGLGVTDVTCGFKAMTGEVAEALTAVLQENGWAFDAEVIFVARKWDLDLREVPVTWRDSGDSTVRPLQAAWRSLQELARIRRHDRAGAYGRPSADRR